MGCAMRTDGRARLAAAGFCCADIYQNLHTWYPTGNGIDWGIHLSRMGYAVSAISVVGCDDYGNGMLEALKSEGLDISHLRREQGDTCITRMELRNGTDRVHLNSVDGVMEHYRMTDEEIAFVGRHDLIHTDLFGRCLEHLPVWRDMGAETLVDFSVYSADPDYRCREIFPYVDYVFFSADGFTGDLRAWMQEISGYGPKLVTATMGTEGSLTCNEQEFYFCPAVPAEKLVNTVGAGDSYIAGFTDGLLRGLPIRECMEAGARLASRVVGCFRPY